MTAIGGEGEFGEKSSVLGRLFGKQKYTKEQWAKHLALRPQALTELLALIEDYEKTDEYASEKAYRERCLEILCKADRSLRTVPDHYRRGNTFGL